MEEDKDTIRCAICNKKLQSIPGHLIKHNITTKEYKQRFPNVAIISTVAKNKMATNSLEYWIKKHGEITGRLKYEELLKKRSNNKLDFWIAKYGKDGKQKYQEYLSKLGHTEDNYIRKHGQEGKGKFEKYIKKRQKAFKNSSISKPEKDLTIQIISLDVISEDFNIVCDILTNDQYAIQDSEYQTVYYYDFVVLEPFKLCVEFHGDYWHCNPKLYESDFLNKSSGKYAHEIWKRDARKKQIIEENGFKYLEVWEDDWNKDKDSILKNIQTIINQLLEQQKVC